MLKCHTVLKCHPCFSDPFPAEDKKKVFNPILVKFRSFEQKVKIMKEKKSWQMQIITLNLKLLKRCTSIKTWHYLAGTFSAIPEGYKWLKLLIARSSVGEHIFNVSRNIEYSMTTFHFLAMQDTVNINKTFIQPMRRQWSQKR